MNLEQINDVINNYDKLVELVHEKIKILEESDNKYNTAKGIESTSFGDGVVYVTCDDTCMGCYDYFSFSFPLNFLTLSDDDLKKVVEQEKKDRIEKERVEKEKKKQKEKIESEQRELEQYQKLKAKFELK